MRYFWLWRLLGFEAVAVALHWSVRRGYFQVEDFLWLRLNDWRSLANSFHGTWGYGAAYRPITRLSYWLDGLAFADWAPAWHFTNVFLHGLNAALLVRLLERLGMRRAPATAAALLFLTAPLTAESVAFISDRTTLICFLFMLLAADAWLTALERPGLFWAAATAVCAMLAAMSYEAGFITPAVLLCLIPISGRSPSPRWVIALLGVVTAALALLFAARGHFIGMLTSNIDGQRPDLWAATTVIGAEVGGLFLRVFGRIVLVCFAAAVLLALVQRRLRLAALASLALAVLFYLPYLPLEGVGDRFFYMTMAPFCALILLPADQPSRTVRLAAVALALVLFLPSFVAGTRAESLAITNAGQRVAVIRRNILADLPLDNVPSIIDGIPFSEGGAPLFGDFFELAIRDAAKPVGPWVVRSDYAERSPIVVYDLLSRTTRFWAFDPATQHLISLTKEEWLARHPEIPGLLAKLGADRNLGLVSQSKDCGFAGNPGEASTNRQDVATISDLEIKAATQSGDGIVVAPLVDGFATFAVALHSLAQAPLALSMSTGPSRPGLPLGLSLCESDPTTGQCRAPAGAALKFQLDPGVLRTFNVFLKACAEIQPDREHSRVFVDFTDEAGKPLASTSVAVQTTPRDVSN